MAFKTTVANQILDKILKNTDFTPASALYISLHAGDPGETGTNEVTGGSYIRKVATFNSAATKATSNVAAVTYTGMPATTVTHVGIWSADTGGAFWWGGALSPSKSVGAGDTFQIAAGDLDVALT